MSLLILKTINKILYIPSILMFFFMLIFLISGCNQPISEKNIFLKTLEENEKVWISNFGKKDLYLSIDINNRFFSSEKDILNAIENLQEEYKNEPPERKAWRFVMNQTLFTSTFTPSCWYAASPLLMFNSFGIGLCGELARTLSEIWKLQGFNSRVWIINNNSHVVAEVFTNGKWQMYDPSFGVYYYNYELMVASVQELSENPNLITNPITELQEIYNRPFIYNARKYSKDISKSYENEQLNRLEIYEGQQITFPDNFYLHLPSGVNIEFPVMTHDTIIYKHYLGELPVKSFIKYTIPAGWKGKLSLPFILAEIWGKGTIKINNEKYNLNETKLNTTLKRFETYYTDIHLLHTESDTELFCIINPRLFNWEGYDSIKISGNQLKNIEIKTIKNDDFSLTKNEYYSLETILSDVAWKYYDHFNSKKQELNSLPILNKCNLSDCDDQCMKESISTFFMTFDNLTPNEKKDKISNLNKKWDDISTTVRKIENQNSIKIKNEFVYFAWILAILENS
jgi:hypothetical protein